MWATQSDHVEVWCEKDALTGIIEPITREMAVPFLPGHGFSSLTMIEQARDRFKEASSAGRMRRSTTSAISIPAVWIWIATSSAGSAMCLTSISKWILAAILS